MVMAELDYLNEKEQTCIYRYLDLLRACLDTNLAQVWLFGSVARGDTWSEQMPMRSDIDLLVLIETRVPEEVRRDLFDETYALFLECGRQLSPTFWTQARFNAPEEGIAEAFVTRVRQEGVQLYP